MNDSNETLKGLLFLTKVLYTNNSDMLKEYHKKRYLTNYFVNISDFDLTNNEIILKGGKSFEHFIDNFQDKLIYNDVEPKKKNYYFVINNDINKLLKYDDKQICLYLNGDKLENIKKICYEWNKENIKENIKEKNRIPFNLITFDGSTGYKKNLITFDSGKGSSKHKIKSEINIIGYLYNKKRLYTAILKISNQK